jgi:hypothetical protein
MTDTFKNFKPLDDVFLLTEHMAKNDFDENAPDDNESPLHRLVSSVESKQPLKSRRPWIY